MSVLITGAQVDGRPADVRVTADRVTDLAPTLQPVPSDEVVDAAGGALLPGLHDHHLHLLAMAAAQTSVACGPPAVRDLAGLTEALRAAGAARPVDTWIRGVGYHESVGGPLDRDALDRITTSHPVRVQHRSGGLWILNGPALLALGIDHPTGRLWRADQLFHGLPDVAMPDLTTVGRDLLDMGITGVTDATPDLTPAALDHLRDAQCRRALPQDVTLLGAPDDDPRRGPRKLLLHDHDLPAFDDLADTIRRTRSAGRAVAVHCVTRQSLLLTLAAIEVAGCHPGDRIEHAAVVPPEARQALAERRIAVVTQPAFVADRGAEYLADVDDDDQALLYPYASLIAAGVAVAPSSDAPFGAPDPWRTMAAAANRRTTNGSVVAGHERVSAAQVLAGYLSPAADPGGTPRRIALGARADLCLLHVPLHEALRHPSRDNVRLTVCGGRVYSASSRSTT